LSLRGAVDASIHTYTNLILRRAVRTTPTPQNKTGVVASFLITISKKCIQPPPPLILLMAV
jgi:hypothetical protein